jgi:multiple sugar transport system substrate-binding protein
MVQIELSYIYSSPQDEATLGAMVAEFDSQHNVKTNLRQMHWPTAWTEILTIASHGTGPDISHIGGTWVSSLAKMNALRPFKPNEIAEMGGASSFMKPAWQSTSLLDDERIWSMPWTGWMYLVCYRKDLLEKAGVDVANAFGTIQAFDKTIRLLKNSSLAIPWLNSHIGPPYTDLLHIAASWVWAAGGDFINSTGTQVAFDSPEAIDGLAMWLETYRAVHPKHKNLDMAKCSALFSAGQAAAILTDIQHANILLDTKNNLIVRQNLGMAPLTDVPWAGGGNFVVWDHVRWHPEREQAALNLIQFLVNKESNLRWKQQCGHMPARADALQEIYPAGNPLHDPMELASRQGRTYYNIPLWRRIENQLAQALGMAVQEAQENPSRPSTDILRTQLEPLARRLNLTLST